MTTLLAAIVLFADPNPPNAEAAARELAALLVETPGVAGVDHVSGRRGGRLLVRVADPAVADALRERFPDGFQGFAVTPIVAAADPVAPLAASSHAPRSGTTYAFHAEHGWTLRIQGARDLRTETGHDPLVVEGSISFDFVDEQPAVATVEETPAFPAGHDPLTAEGRVRVQPSVGAVEVFLHLDRIAYWDGRVAFEIRFGRPDTDRQIARAAEIVEKRRPAADDPIGSGSHGERQLALALADLNGRTRRLGTGEVDAYLGALVALAQPPREDSAVRQRRTASGLTGTLRQIGDASQVAFGPHDVMRWDDSVQLGAGGVADVRYLENRVLDGHGAVRSVRARLQVRGREIPWRTERLGGRLSLDYKLEARLRRVE